MSVFFTDLLNSSGGGQSIAPQVIASATTTNGSSIDTGPIGPQMMSALLNVGTLVGAGNTVAAKIQESADGSTGWVDVTGATFTSVTAAGFGWCIFQNALRYVRVVITTTGTVTSAPVSAQVIFNGRFTGGGGGWTNS